MRQLTMNLKKAISNRNYRRQNDDQEPPLQSKRSRANFTPCLPLFAELSWPETPAASESHQNNGRQDRKREERGLRWPKVALWRWGLVRLEDDQQATKDLLHKHTAPKAVLAGSVLCAWDGVRHSSLLPGLQASHVAHQFIARKHHLHLRRARSRRGSGGQYSARKSTALRVQVQRSARHRPTKKPQHGGIRCGVQRQVVSANQSWSFLINVWLSYSVFVFYFWKVLSATSQNLEHQRFVVRICSGFHDYLPW